MDWPSNQVQFIVRIVKPLIIEVNSRVDGLEFLLTNLEDNQKMWSTENKL